MSIIALAVITFMLASPPPSGAQASPPPQTPNTTPTPNPESGGLGLTANTFGPDSADIPAGRPDYNEEPPGGQQQDNNNQERSAPNILSGHHVTKPAAVVQLSWDAPTTGTVSGYEIRRGRYVDGTMGYEGIVKHQG